MNYPVYVPVFNNPTYTKYFIQQLANLNIKNVIIIDNNSESPQMKDLLFKLSEDYEVIRLKENKGPHFILRDQNFYKKLPNVFCLSDPDLEFSSNIPNMFIRDLYEISNTYKKGKVALALEIPKDDDLNKPYIFLDNKMWKMSEYELERWKNPIGKFKDVHDLYLSNLDTTFALYNKEFFEPNNRYESIMISGIYTVKHLGWYKNSIVPDQEKLYYEKSTRYSYTAGSLNSEGAPVFEITVHEYTKIMEEIDSLKLNNKLLVEQNLKLSKDIQKLFTSLSWKFTIPLRLISSVIKKIITFLNFNGKKI